MTTTKLQAGDRILARVGEWVFTADVIKPLHRSPFFIPRVITVEPVDSNATYRHLTPEQVVSRLTPNEVVREYQTAPGGGVNSHLSDELRRLMLPTGKVGRR